MKYQITVIGTGFIGTSIGLALKEHTEKYYRVGHDIDSGAANLAKKMSAFDKLHFNLPNSIKKADIIVLALPSDQIEEVIKFIAQDVKQGSVILDTSPIRNSSIKWANQYLDSNTYYVGFTPLISPLHIHGSDGGTLSGNAELFTRGLIAISSGPNTIEGAMKVAANLAEDLGSDPLFADQYEVDSYLGTLHTFPQLLAATLTNATIKQTGWLEGRKFAGKPFALSTLPISIQDTPASLTASINNTKEPVLRALDEMVRELMNLREFIVEDKFSDIENFLHTAREGRNKWWKERGAANWHGEQIPVPDYQSAKLNILGKSFADSRSDKDD